MNIAIQTYIPLEELVPVIAPADLHDFINEMGALGDLAPVQIMEDKFGKLFRDILAFCAHTGLVEKQGEMLHLSASARHLNSNTDLLQLLLYFSPYRLLLLDLAREPRAELSRDHVFSMWHSLGYDIQHKNAEKSLLALFKYLDHLQMGKLHKIRGESPRLQLFRPALALIQQLLEDHVDSAGVSVVMQSEPLQEPTKELVNHAQPSLFTDWETEMPTEPEEPDPIPPLGIYKETTATPVASPSETTTPKEEIPFMSIPEVPMVSQHEPPTLIRSALNLHLTADMSKWDYSQVDAFLQGVLQLPPQHLKLDIRADMTQWSLEQIRTFFNTAQQLG